MKTNRILTVFALIATFALAGCATTGVPRRGAPGLIQGVVLLPFAVLGAGVEVLTGYEVFQFSEAQRQIAEYAGSHYAGRDVVTCKNAAYGSLNNRRSGYGSYGYDYYNRNSSGLKAGRLEHDRLVSDDCRAFGEALGNSGY